MKLKILEHIISKSKAIW